MATVTLVNNTGTFTFSNDQKNSFTLQTENKFVDSDISITTKVTKAVLTTDSQDTDHKTFNIQIPNGSPNSNILLTFTTDSSGNTVVTGSNVT